MTRETEDHSYWNATAGEGPAFPTLAGDIEVDVAIIGGGIVGVTTARLLKDRGLKVALVEARRVGRQVTGKSTAKMSSQHGILYQTLEQVRRGQGAALRRGAGGGIRKIAELAGEHGIDADIEPKPAFVYTNDESTCRRSRRRWRSPGGSASRQPHPRHRPSVRRAAGDALGRPGPIPPDQICRRPRRHPPGDGCHVFENSRAIDYEPDRVVTDGGTIKARHVVMATHLPLGQVGMYYAIAYPMAEPVIAAPIGRVPPGMYKNAEQPGHSIRTHKGADGQVWGIVAGKHYKPGHVDDEQKYIADIERWLPSISTPGPVAIAGSTRITARWTGAVRRLVEPSKAAAATWSPPASPPGASPTAPPRR
jgi:glycine/D-amino acid oxidase-like deaminating enzyme